MCEVDSVSILDPGNSLMIKNALMRTYIIFVRSYGGSFQGGHVCTFVALLEVGGVRENKDKFNLWASSEKDNTK